MQYHLDTIPVWEAMEQNTACPLCALYRRVEAAERLGIGRNTLTRKIRELALEEAITGRTIPPHEGGAS